MLCVGTQVFPFVVLISTLSFSPVFLKHWISFPNSVLLQGEATSLSKLSSWKLHSEWAALSFPDVWCALPHETEDLAVPWGSVRLLVWCWWDWWDKSAAFSRASSWAGAEHSLNPLGFCHWDLLCLVVGCSPAQLRPLVAGWGSKKEEKMPNCPIKDLSALINGVNYVWSLRSAPVSAE